MKDSLNLFSSFFIKLNRSSARNAALGAFASSVLLLACSSQPDRTGQSSTGGATSGSGGSSSDTGGAFSDTGGASSDTGGATSSTGGITGTGGSDITPPPAHCDTATKLPLPLTVSEHFGPSGWMPEDLVCNYMPTCSPIRIPEDVTCPTPPEGAVGTCYVFDFIPANAAMGWTGIAFLSAPDNWAGPGHCVADGATKIKFYARGEVGGEVVSFGGVSEGAGTGDIPLTAEWEPLEFSIPSTYNAAATNGGVTSGFSWVMAAAAQTDTEAESFRFYVTGIQWVAE